MIETGQIRLMTAAAKGERTIVSSVQILPAADVLDTLFTVTAKVAAVILGPWYNRGVGGQREDYDDWLTAAIRAVTEKTAHVFVCGFPEILANQVRAIPDGWRSIRRGGLKREAKVSTASFSLQ